ncbi:MULTISPECIES: cytochrome-c peroxidase [Methylomonas]|uniref:Cytochrome B6 n=1 Tax=Methylomonas koyamae TaxID=702114 RepID=A0A177P0Y4_9GAMM|nr:cytochrome c peroxidase [Methylomonas koyamae]OAI22990.1 cytochrome B6 [Methylomonas koyamae]
MNRKRYPGILAIGWLSLACAGLARAEVPPTLLPLPTTVGGDPKRTALGQRLFHEPKLSDQAARSCASCHPLDRGGMDGKARAVSADGAAVLRNTPSLFNVAFNYFFNWDGVVTTLEAHTEKVMLNPNIMNAKWPGVIARLAGEADYVAAFANAYPDGLTPANVVDAVTSFERSLVTPNARFDRFLRGDSTALSAEEQQGYRLFNDLGCVACHQGINLGGNLFQKFGVFGRPPSAAELIDAGRYLVTGNPRDSGVFRVPSLRNVAATAPYFHDGRAADLETAVNTMAKYQLGKPLAERQRDLLVKFLHSLTGEYRGKSLLAEPSAKP